MAVTDSDRRFLGGKRHPVQLAEAPDSWGQQLVELRGSALAFPLASLFAILFGMLAASLLYVQGTLSTAQIVWIELLLTLAAACVVGLCLYRVQRTLLRPLARMRHWAARMRGGDLRAPIPVPSGNEIAPLATDLSGLCEELKRLKSDLDSRVNKQTERLAQKNASLQILYDMADRINRAPDLDDLLLNFLRILKEMVGARAATVRLVSIHEEMRLVGCIGLDDTVVRKERLLPVPLCQCGTALSAGDIVCRKDPRVCSRTFGRTMFGVDEIDVVAVPLRYQDTTLGVYNLFVGRPGISGREDILELLTTIGSHLGMAVAKSRLDEESKHVSIMEERNAFANELHDSLAQTLASLRFQVQVLNDILHAEGNADALRQAMQITNSLDEAHTEMRELITHFRAPLDDRGLLPAIEQLVERFRRETGIAVFFQQEYHWTYLPVNIETQVLRIVQEGLANVRKHSHAQLVRLLVRTDADGTCLVLVEDDGVGFRMGQFSERPGEHLGLSILQERARRLGGELRIETEPGEGTRIELRFAHPRGRAFA